MELVWGHLNGLERNVSAVAVGHDVTVPVKRSDQVVSLPAASCRESQSFSPLHLNGAECRSIVAQHRAFTSSFARASSRARQKSLSGVPLDPFRIGRRMGTVD